MKPSKSLIQSWPWVELAILGFCAWQARDLVTAWRHSPYDQAGFVALLIWVLPLAWCRRSAGHAGFLGAAILAGGLGQVLELHVLGQVALAWAIAAWMPPVKGRLIWLGSALSWMPWLGWEGISFAPGTVLAVRILLALGGAIYVSRKHFAKSF